MSAAQNLKKLGIVLPEMSPAIALYRPVCMYHDMAFISGQIPMDLGTGKLVTGKVGAAVDVETARAAARLCGVRMLGALSYELGGDLDRVVQVVKLVGFVNSTDDFGEHPEVINGISELMRDVFGEEKGVSARSAVGVNSLPRNVCVEVEGMFQIREK